MLYKKGGFWILLFGFIFLLTQDYLWIDWTAKPGFLGLPNWLGWFIGVHLLFILAFYFFSRNFWKKD